VDDPTARGLVRPRVEVFAVEIREEYLAVVECLRDQRLGLLNREHEAHAEDNGALEGDPLVELQPLGRADDRGQGREERGNPLHLPLVEYEWTGPSAPPPPDVSNFDRGHSRPLPAGHSTRDTAAVSGQLIQTDLASVPLGDGVGGHQAEVAPISQ